MPRADLARLYPLLVADFQREYGVDLLGAHRRMGAARFLLLVQGLSASSLLWGQIGLTHRAEANRPLEGEDATRALRAFFAGG